MSEASTVLNKPSELTLTDGTVIEIRFTLYSFAVIEDEFDSAEEMQNALAKGSVRTIGKLIAASIVDDSIEMTGDQVLKKLPLADLNKIVKILGDSMSDATGGASETKDVSDLKAPEGETSNSLGSGFTTSEESLSDSVLASSGT